MTETQRRSYYETTADQKVVLNLVDKLITSTIPENDGINEGYLSVNNLDQTLLPIVPETALVNMSHNYLLNEDFEKIVDFICNNFAKGAVQVDLTANAFEFDEKFDALLTRLMHHVNLVDLRGNPCTTALRQQNLSSK